MNHLFSLPPGERFILAQQLLDSIDASEASKCEERLEMELKRRREEMIRGEQIAPDWRAALLEIERAISPSI
jgi:hypothetical protein